MWKIQQKPDKVYKNPPAHQWTNLSKCLWEVDWCRKLYVWKYHKSIEKHMDWVNKWAPSATLKLNYSTQHKVFNQYSLYRSLALFSCVTSSFQQWTLFNIKLQPATCISLNLSVCCTSEVRGRGFRSYEQWFFDTGELTVKVTFHPFDEVSVVWPDVLPEPLLTAACRAETTEHLKHHTAHSDAHAV